MKKIKTMPGTRASTPAAASNGTSAANMVAKRDMRPPMGLALTTVRAPESKVSVHENRKQKNAATAIPGAICGSNMRRKNPVKP